MINKVFDVVILSAGRGERLRPKTDNVPKGLLSMFGNTILQLQLSAIRKYVQGDLFIVTGYKRECYLPYLRNGIYEIYNDKWNIYNNIYSLYLFLERHKARLRDMLIVNSDTIFDYHILAELLNDPSECAFACDKVKILGKEEMKVCLDDKNNVIAIGKSFPPDECQGEYIGIAKFSVRGAENLFNAIGRLLNMNKTKDWYESAFNLMAEEKFPIKAISTRGLPWIEVDTLDDLNKAEQMINKCKYGFL